MRKTTIETMKKELNLESNHLVGENLETALSNDEVKFSFEDQEAVVFSLWGSNFVC